MVRSLIVAAVLVHCAGQFAVAQYGDADLDLAALQARSAGTAAEIARLKEEIQERSKPRTRRLYTAQDFTHPGMVKRNVEIERVRKELDAVFSRAKRPGNERRAYYEVIVGVLGALAKYPDAVEDPHVNRLYQEVSSEWQASLEDKESFYFELRLNDYDKLSRQEKWDLVLLCSKKYPRAMLQPEIHSLVYGVISEVRREAETPTSD